MNKNHKIFIGAAVATAAYFYFVAKTSKNAQSVPGINFLYNAGYNLGDVSIGAFSFAAPPQASATSSAS